MDQLMILQQQPPLQQQQQLIPQQYGQQLAQSQLIKKFYQNHNQNQIQQQQNIDQQTFKRVWLLNQKNNVIHSSVQFSLSSEEFQDLVKSQVEKNQYGTTTSQKSGFKQLSQHHAQDNPFADTNYATKFLNAQSQSCKSLHTLKKIGCQPPEIIYRRGQFKRNQSLKKDIQYYYSSHQQFAYKDNQSFPPKFAIKDLYPVNSLAKQNKKQQNQTQQSIIHKSGNLSSCASPKASNPIFESGVRIEKEPLREITKISLLSQPVVTSTLFNKKLHALKPKSLVHKNTKGSSISVLFWDNQKKQAQSQKQSKKMHQHNSNSTQNFSIWQRQLGNYNQENLRLPQLLQLDDGIQGSENSQFNKQYLFSQEQFTNFNKFKKNLIDIYNQYNQKN